MAHLLSETVTNIDEYFASETGGLGLKRANELGPERTIELMQASGLRGRGGGGFPTGQKWAGVRAQTGTHRYVVANGAEGEPGTFKDRTLLRVNPYQLVEGVMIAAFAIDAVEAYIALKGSFEREIEAVTRAVMEMQAAGIGTDFQITIVRGPDEYLFGEEKAMLEVIEGNDPLPRLLPPHEHGLFATAPQTGWVSHERPAGHTGQHLSNPTLVNNVETLSNAPHILAKGAEWFRSVGTAESPGTLVCTVVGDVLQAAVGEVELGTPLSDVIRELGGGVADGRFVKAVLSGVANPVVTSEHLDVPLTYEAFAEIGSGMGAGGFIVLDETACMVEATRQFSRFLYIESCAQCPACKRGTREITEALTRIEAGDGTEKDIAAIDAALDKVTDSNRCYLPVEEASLVASMLQAFPDEFAEHINGGACPRPRAVPLPKLVDIIDGVAVYDERHASKQPDWTSR